MPVAVFPKDLLPNGAKINVRLTLDGYFMTLSNQDIQKLGYTAAQIANRSFYEFVHIDDLPIVKDVHNKALANPSSKHTTFYRLPTCTQTPALTVAAEWMCFKNPASGSSQFLVVKHQVVKPARSSTDQTQLVAHPVPQLKNETTTGSSAGQSSSQQQQPSLLMQKLLSKMPTDRSSHAIGAGHLNKLT